MTILFKDENHNFKVIDANYLSDSGVARFETPHTAICIFCSGNDYNDIGKKLFENGKIDLTKFQMAYE